jgi:putative SOS response-associated peptidase YedK
MCGRFTIMLDADDAREAFGLSETPTDWTPRYNVAPTQMLPVLVSAQERKVAQMRWGLVPSWAKDPEIGNRMINARSETLEEKPAFRNAFKSRRCLILADGFYEWQRSAGGKSPSVPHFFRRADGNPFSFAGLWEFWRSPDGQELRTCTIITCSANALVAPVHERMPVMLSGDEGWKWLSPQPSSALLPLLRPYPADEMVRYPVSRAVNFPDRDGPELVQPLAG